MDFELEVNPTITTTTSRPSDTNEANKTTNYDDEEKPFSFVKTFPTIYPPDWSSSPANHYIRPNTEDIDAVDTSLLTENERCLSLCLAPFSKAFYIATGYSKLQIPEENLELISVIVWNHRRQIKQGLPGVTPEELEFFFKTRDGTRF
jgi:hypothetical protein